MTKNLQAYRDVMVHSLVTQGYISSEPVKRAFATVPRHLFVHHYYVRQPGTPHWDYHEASDTEVWYRQVYSDTAFVTLVDEMGRTLSSSSQPAVMARMLELLDVQPGQRVLEIGTGSGYNTTLLAQLTGNPALVTTIDIEPEVMPQAMHAIEQSVGSGVTLHIGDGSQGYLEHAPYQRIIATASTPTVPAAWAEQLAPSGTLVCILQPGISMCGGILQATKTAGGLSGQVIYKATFMPLHTADFRYLPARTPHLNMKIPVLATFPFDSQFFDPSFTWDPDFQFFLFYTIPDVSIVEQTQEGRPPFTIFYEGTLPDCYVSFFEEQGKQQVELRGSRAPIFWKRLIHLYTFWVLLGRPSVESYHFKMNQDGQQLYLSSEKGMFWPFAGCEK
ncbi:MAG TPA: methyltransferase domain-containing protein [Ktedonobacteraceae bacterium]|nr:methyltransferase domain-containing protein [Ktedonobacteraceae bacterium]